MTKTVAVAQARMGSQRVPGKVMRDLNGKPVLRWTIDAISSAIGIDAVILATSILEQDDNIAQYCLENNITCFRGSESDVLDRFYHCARMAKADIVLRFTCDCPFLDPTVISEVIKLREMTNADYASNCYPPSYPDGLDTECFTFAALEAAWKETTSKVDRDCLTQFIVRNRDRFKVVNLTCPLPGLVKERWVLDTEDDWKFCITIAKYGALEQAFGGLYVANRGALHLDILKILNKYPEIRKLNAGGIRNERFYEALSTEQLSPRTFKQSQRVFERAIQTIPSGAQTFSKSHIQFPCGAAPLYVSHGDGAYIFDIDGNRYIDLIGALCPVVLGYADPDVDESIRRQLDNGISFSLATKLETELAELLQRLIPCAEMAKLGKSGTDVTTAAIRLARAYTGKEHVFLTGYHGWADWSIVTTENNKGVLNAVKYYSHKLPYGDTAAVANQFVSLKSNTAAIIVEPTDDLDYLQWLREFCNRNGIVLIFDEIITGFRYDIGGAQKLYDVTPDLACFGKSMANGMPISALVGKREIMKLMETPDVFYSGTFFGETLSIAAAIATINKMEAENVIDHLCNTGARLEFAILKLLNNYDLHDVISIDGWFPYQKLTFKDARGATGDQIRTLFMREMIQNGVLIIASNNLSYAIKEPEIKRIVTAYENTFASISACLKRGDIFQLVGEGTQASPLRAA